MWWWAIALAWQSLVNYISFSLQVQLMVPGVPGLAGLSVPIAVVEELGPGGDSVTVQLRPTVAETAMVTTLSRDGATLTSVLSQVKIWK